MPTTRAERRRTHRLVVVAVVVALVLAGLGYVWHTVRDFNEGFGSSTCRAVASTYTATFNPDQTANAATITGIGTRRGLPARAATIALATAIQESKLENIDYGDRDSVGLFQQRPSQGWGTPEQLQDPVYAAGKFFDHLVEVPGWETGRLTEVAQTVQRSGFPEAYQQWEAMATTLAGALLSTAPTALSCGFTPAADQAPVADRIAGIIATVRREAGEPVVDAEGALREMQERMQAAKARLVPFVGEENAEGSLGAVRGMPACGTPEQIVENLRALEKAGLSYGIFNFAEAAYDRSGIELFEREVVPALGAR